MGGGAGGDKKYKRFMLFPFFFGMHGRVQALCNFVEIFKGNFHYHRHLQNRTRMQQEQPTRWNRVAPSKAWWMRIKDAMHMQGTSCFLRLICPVYHCCASSTMT